MGEVAAVDRPPTQSPFPSAPALAPAVLVTAPRRGAEGLARRLLAEATAHGRAARAGAAADIVLDLSGTPQAAEMAGETWRLRAAGAPIGEALAGVWHRPPYWLPVTLTRVRPGQAEEALAVARVGTAGGYAELRERVDAAACLLFRRALAAHSRDELLGDDDAGLDAHTASSPAGTAAWVGGWLRWRAARWHARLFAEWWSVGVSERPIEAVLQPGQLGEVAWLRPEMGASYWADPFAWDAGDGDPRILCEECPTESGAGVGVIVALRRDAGGAWERDGVLLADHRHRSYPFTFADEGITYLMPECLDGATVLYRLDASGEVEPVATVAPQGLADPTLFRHEGRFWVAGTDVAIGTHDNLCLFAAGRPEGPWRPHRGNPVKIDVTSSRPAGTPFRHDGRLFRPAQDCARTYGAAVAINEVTALTLDTFAERVVARLEPRRGGLMPDGLHTLAAAGPRTLIDGKRMVFAPAHLLRRAVRRLTRGTRHFGMRQTGRQA